MYHNFIMADKDYVYINAPYAEAYIPESIIVNPDGEVSDSAIAYENGEVFTTIGIFYIRFFPDEETPRDKVEMHTMIYPNKINTMPSDHTSTIIMAIGANGNLEKYRVLKYYKGDVLMDAHSIKSHTNCEMFMRMLSTAKIPASLSYDQIFQAWMDNYAINGITPEAPAVMLQVIIAEMCRNPSNPSQQFAKIIGKYPDKVDPHSYKCMTMNEVSAYSSVMSALSFERMTEKLTTSISMTKTGAEQKRSPLEEIVTM